MNAGNRTNQIVGVTAIEAAGHAAFASNRRIRQRLQNLLNNVGLQLRELGFNGMRHRIFDQATNFIATAVIPFPVLFGHAVLVLG
jgi:hypothetical protein